MKSLLVAGLTATVLTGGATLERRLAAEPQDTSGAAPWQVGQCYRVFPGEPNTYHTFKVLEPPRGSWVRVQPSPTSMLAPGARPQAPLWINSQSAFAVQEWNCGL